METSPIHCIQAEIGIFENNRLAIGEQKNAIENFYALLLTEFRHMVTNPPPPPLLNPKDRWQLICEFTLADFLSALDTINQFTYPANTFIFFNVLLYFIFTAPGEGVRERAGSGESADQ